MCVWVRGEVKRRYDDTNVWLFPSVGQLPQAQPFASQQTVGLQLCENRKCADPDGMGTRLPDNISSHGHQNNATLPFVCIAVRRVPELVGAVLNTAPHRTK